MWISAIPLTLVAYFAGDLQGAVAVLTMIFITSAFEAYYLNPTIVSNYFKLPISVTFLVLMIGEHYFGVAGLLIGVSLFYFVLGLLRDFDKSLKKYTW